MTHHDRHDDDGRLRADAERLGEDDLARLADGTLPASEHAALQARLASSPQLRARLHEQERAIALVRASDEVHASDALRASLGEMLGDPSPGRRRRRRRPAERRQNAVWRPRAWVALAVLAVALIAVVSLALHGTTAPTVARAARLASAPASGPAPATDPRDRALLTLQPTGAGGIRFPSYVRATGWQAVGARRDTLDGRRVTTVFYAHASRRVGYAVVSGPALVPPRGTTVRGPTGVRYVLGSSDGTRLITWQRDGHTCVIAGRAVGRRTLLTLALADEAA